MYAPFNVRWPILLSLLFSIQFITAKMIYFLYDVCYDLMPTKFWLRLNSALRRQGEIGLKVWEKKNKINVCRTNQSWVRNWFSLHRWLDWIQLYFNICPMYRERSFIDRPPSNFFTRYSSDGRTICSFLNSIALHIKGMVSSFFFSFFFSLLCFWWRMAVWTMKLTSK